MPLGVELRAPHLVRRLMLVAAERDGRSQPEVYLVQALERIDETLGIDLRRNTDTPLSVAQLADGLAAAQSSLSPKCTLGRAQNGRFPSSRNE
jgi:hypothetical protein